MKKKCISCGKIFDAPKATYFKCPECYSGKSPASGGGSEMKNPHGPFQGSKGGGPRSNFSQSDRPGGLPKDLCLDSFFTPDGAIREEVYIKTAKGIAQALAEDTPTVTTASVRRFFESVRAAYDRYLQERSYPKALEGIFRLHPLAKRSQDRGITNAAFTDFIFHYANLTAKDEKNLRGFKELFMSVVCYLKK
ncbi:MAG: hypothetical protein GHCLOJNM_04635 [bacterium]|nr:hypothetical protein [bacterium]